MPSLSTEIAGTSSEAIGTNSNFGQLYVSNSISGTKQTPSVNGVNFSINSFSLTNGTNQIIAAIGDGAGNVGYTTGNVTIAIVTNANYLENTAGCVTNINYAGADNIGLTWNSQYQLTDVKTNGVTCESYSYDVSDRRVKEVVGSDTNYFVYDGVHVVADVNSTGGLIRSYTYGPGIDNVLSMTVYTGATAVTYYYIKDHLGNVHALVDGTGAIVESYRFDAWGKVLGVYDGSGALLAESAIGNRILWQGREYSYRTGLYYFRARWYDPITGRWLSNDPIRILGGLNQYVFCNNNPVNFKDEFGLVDLNLHDPNDTEGDFYNRAQRAAPVRDANLNLRFVVAGHGGRDLNQKERPYYAWTIVDYRSGKQESLSPSKLAKEIYKLIEKGKYKAGQTVQLEACRVGEGPGGDRTKSYAQQLADELTKLTGTTTLVRAPTSTGDYDASELGKFILTDPEGEWVLFEGRNTTK